MSQNGNISVIDSPDEPARTSSSPNQNTSHTFNPQQQTPSNEPPADIDFISHPTNIYPPTPLAYPPLSPLPSQIPPVNPILPSVYPEHEILEYLDSLDVDDSFFDTVPSQLNDIFNLPNIPPSDRVSSNEPKTKLITTGYLQVYCIL